MPEGQNDATVPPPAGGALRGSKRLDWEKAVSNHQSEEKLVAFLQEYPPDLRRIISSMREALANNEMEKLREAAQQVMGSASYIAANALKDSATMLVEALDLDDAPEQIKELAEKTANEAEELEREISEAFAKPAPLHNPAKNPSCCNIM